MESWKNWITLAFFSILGAGYSIAQPIVLDSTFGFTGRVLTNIGNGENRAFSLTLLDNDKIVLGGVAHNGLNYDFALSRYNQDGTLDLSFGTGGTMMTDIRGGQDRILSIAVNASQELVAAGYATDSLGISDFCIAKYQTGGSLDPTFGNGGVVLTRINNSDAYIHDMILPDGNKILVAGKAFNGPDGDFALARYNADGSLDSSFHFDGISTVDFGAWNEEARAVLVRGDGRILVSGISLNQLAIARLHPDGTIDSTFGQNGKLLIDVGNGMGIESGMALQQDGKILLSGSHSAQNGKDILLVRCNEHGSLDSSFAVNGKAVVDYCGSVDEGSSVVVQADGKIIVTGETYCGNYSDYAIARFNTDGSLDTTAGPSGRVQTDFNGFNEWGFESLITPDGFLLVAGEGHNGINYAFTLARYRTGVASSNFAETTANFNLNFAPNPFLNEAELSIGLPESSDIEISILDAMGREVLRRDRQLFLAGTHEFALQLTDKAGIYIVVAKSGTTCRVLRVLKAE